MKIEESEKNEDIVQLVLPLLDVVQCFANGSLSVENLNESQKADFQSWIKIEKKQKNLFKLLKTKREKLNKVQLKII
ncbi:unnamed protein product (macronuclear) [Paramecium tetraurelia]|uniref:Uncharacterized protein n=1 Tax=Paramecium tetraurelia TaxID=5888 RepID=A0E011_PARTE|nr:uncharacterized protein GSPATT00021796001 [Paramecium tetraurelia]CAK88628.1 unnamed protein product [Paramecium tetraurelia]|eukprot:XP_001456025.1 hypothetical protein (macronuclear) [Paramecium tetraurelia strain d4-2]